VKKFSFIIIAIITVVGIGFFFRFQSKKSLQPDWIVYVVIDTLRADHLHCYGYPRNTTPFIDNVARRGVVFYNAYSHSATTGPSHSSMFTSLYPYQHEVYSNRFILKNEFLTLAEYLKSKGYFTAAAVSVQWMDKLNLNQGFKIFDQASNERIEKRISPPYRPAAETVERLIEIIKERELYKKKAFLWIHLFDPHVPLVPPAEYISRLRKNNDREKMIEYLLNVQKIRLSPFKGNIESMYNHILRYDAEIAYADAQLARFYEFVRGKVGKKKVLWIITSDHGEGLGGHNWVLHAKYIYKEFVHVPLILLWENFKIKPRRINSLVGHVDLFPTITEIFKEDLNKKVKKQEAILFYPLFLVKKNPCESSFLRSVKGKKKMTSFAP